MNDVPLDPVENNRQGRHSPGADGDEARRADGQPAEPDELPFGYGILPSTPAHPAARPREEKRVEPVEAVPSASPERKSCEKREAPPRKAEPKGEELPFGYGILEGTRSEEAEETTRGPSQPAPSPRKEAIATPREPSPAPAAAAEPMEGTGPAKARLDQEPEKSSTPGPAADEEEEEIFQFSLVEPPEEPEGEDDFEKLVPPGPLEEVKFEEELRPRPRRRRPRRRRKRVVEAESRPAEPPAAPAAVPSRRRRVATVVAVWAGAVAALALIIWLILNLAQ